MKEKFFQRPAMVSQSSDQSGSSLNPMEAMPTHRKAETQALVKVTEVIDATENIHALLQGGTLASEMAGTPAKASQALAESGIQPFNVGSIDHATALCCLE